MPFRSPIFRKLLLSSFLLIFGTVVVLDFYLTRYVSGREVETAAKGLQTQVRILAGELASASPDGIRAWCKFAALRSSSRVTLIGPGGVVLADSEHDAATMENHSGRPEIREAFAGREGKAIRHSATIRRDLIRPLVAFNFGADARIPRLAGTSQSMAGRRGGSARVAAAMSRTSTRGWLRNTAQSCPDSVVTSVT